MTDRDTDLSTEAFWEQRARAFAQADPEGWAAVCHRGAPIYANKFIDWSQRRAFARLMRNASFSRGDTAVDVGTGTGRWARELAAAGLDVTGYDVSPTMVARARELSPDIRFEIAPASALPIPDGSAQLATSITVIHHIPHGEQPAAAAELSRVLRPGGQAIVVVLLDTLPSGSWCFTRNRRGWLDLFATVGLHPSLAIGEEYVTPAIVFGVAASAVAKVRRGRSRPQDIGAGVGGAARRLLHRAAVRSSYPVEGLCQLLPGTWGATGLGLLLTKSPQS